LTGHFESDSITRGKIWEIDEERSAYVIVTNEVQMERNDRERRRKKVLETDAT
jgi:hypothetical protein